MGLAADGLILTIISAFSTLVTLGLDIALFVVALTVVRKHRPDAFLLLAISPAIHFCAAIFSSAAYALAARFAYGGPGLLFGAVHVGTTLFYGASTLCLLVGIVRLARSPAEPTAWDRAPIV